MLKAMFYKEWIKCHNIISLLISLAVALSVYIIISSNYTFRNSGIMTTWLGVVDGGEHIIPTYFCWFLTSIGGIIAAVQFSSEMVNKRMKLTLHLPRAESNIVLSLCAFGLLATVVLYVITIIILTFCLQLSYPQELVCGEIARISPYLMGGFALYHLSAMVVVEPIWRRKVAYMLVSIGAVYPFLTESKIGANAGMTPALFLIIMASVTALFLSVIRFKDGAQS